MDKELMIIEVLKLNENDRNIILGEQYKVFSTEYINEGTVEDFILTMALF